MNERKLKQLFESARREPAPVPPADLDSRVMRAIRREPGPATLPLWDQLNALFPRVAWAAVAVIVLSLAADYGLSAAGVPGLSDGISQISAAWFLTPNGF